MESIILMNSKWGNDIYIPMYLFFGGLTGGMFIVAVVADLIGIKHKAFESFSNSRLYCPASASICWTVHYLSPGQT